MSNRVETYQKRIELIEFASRTRVFIYFGLGAFWHPLLGHYREGAKLKLTCTLIVKTDLLSARLQVDI